MSFRPHSRCRHLSHMQQRDGGGFYVVSTPFASLPPSSLARARWRWFLWPFALFAPPQPPSHEMEVVLWPFDPVRTTATSLAYNSELDVGFYGPLTPFAPPLPLTCNSESEVVCMAFRLRSRCRHLPCMQQQAGP